MTSDQTQTVPPMPHIPGLVEQSTANPYAKPGSEVSFKEFASDFMLFLKKHFQFQYVAESDGFAETRTSCRKVSITRAGTDAPPGSHVLKLHETTRVTYFDAPPTPNLNEKGIEALGFINAMRRDAGGVHEADWWLTFSPPSDLGTGWKFEYAETQNCADAGESSEQPRERVIDTPWINDVLDACNEICVIYTIAYTYEHGNSRGAGKDPVKAVAMYHRAAALPPGPGPYFEKYQAVFVAPMDMHLNGSAAKCNLADKYEHGMGAPQDYQKALFWYNESAKQKNGVAEYSLANMFDKGLGVQCDVDATIAWFERARAHDCAWGDKRLDELRKERANGIRP